METLVRTEGIKHRGVEDDKTDYPLGLIRNLSKLELTDCMDITVPIVTIHTILTRTVVVVSTGLEPGISKSMVKRGTERVKIMLALYIDSVGRQLLEITFWVT